METVEEIEPGEEIGEEQGKDRLRRKVNREERESGCGFVQGREEKRWEKIQKWKRMWWVKTWERERSKVCPVWSGLGFETIFPSLSLCAYISYSRTPSSPPAIPSTTRNPALHHSFPLPPSPAPSIPGGAAAWVAGGGRRRDLGAPSQEANRCSPSGVSQMADIKKSRGGGETEKDENIPQDEQATEFCTFLSFLFFIMPCQKRGFSSFLLSCWSFLQVLLQRLRTVDHFLILLLPPHKASL